MYKRSRFQSLFLAAILFAFASYLFFSILGALFTILASIQFTYTIRVLIVPGFFLYSSFSIMALYPVLYLVYNAILIGQGVDTPQSLAVSTLLFFPMLSLSILIRLLVDSNFVQTTIGSWVVNSFSYSGAVTVAGIVSLILLLIMFYINATFQKKNDSPKIKNSDSLPQIPKTTVSEELEIPNTGIDSFMKTKLSEFSAKYDAESSYDSGISPTSSVKGMNMAVKDKKSYVWYDHPDGGANTTYMDYHIDHEDHEDHEDDESLRHEDLNDNETIVTLNFNDNPSDMPEAHVDISPEDFLPHDDRADDVIENKNDPDQEREWMDSEKVESIQEEFPSEQFQSFLDEDHIVDLNNKFEYEGSLLINTDVLPQTDIGGDLEPYNYTIPITGVLEKQNSESYWVIDDETNEQASLLRKTLKEFGIVAEITGIRKGPSITMFEILPAPGVKLSRIANLSDNIALSLAATSVRIVAPIPNKHAVGIEVPNRRRHLVTFSEILLDGGFLEKKHMLPVALGKDITGEAQIIDLAKTPHILIAGATGAGKSVCVNSLIASLLYRRSPEEVKMILIDPKIVELKFYNDIPHLLTPVITDAKRAFQSLQWCLCEMERRYSLLDAMAVRDVQSYNRKVTQKNITTPILPYIVVVVDEFADLMASSGKELESTLARLAAMSRAVGMHLVLATQRPSTDVITGLIKANIPSRIAFMVASKVDSRIIIDSMGAEKLLGRGDMLFTSAWEPFPKRIQGAYLSEEEVERIVSHVRTMGSPDYIDDEMFFDDENEDIYLGNSTDPLTQKAIDIVYSANKASASYLQRRLSIGYNRAARLVEEMEGLGIVGPQNGSKPREVLRQV